MVLVPEDALYLVRSLVHVAHVQLSTVRTGRAVHSTYRGDKSVWLVQHQSFVCAFRRCGSPSSLRKPLGRKDIKTFFVDPKIIKRVI